MGREQILTLIPHAGKMCLLHGLIDWDAERISCFALSHRAPDNPLRRAGRLRSICAIEYAAQTMALHGALTARSGPRPRAGYLASVRELVCHVAFLDDVAAELRISSERLLAQGERVIYAFEIRGDHHPLVSGRAAVVMDAAAP